MPEIKVVPLGAGQDVGRSCILVSIGGKNIMLDCGMHMGYNDERRFPDFSYISKNGSLDEHLGKSYSNRVIDVQVMFRLCYNKSFSLGSLRGPALYD